MAIVSNNAELMSALSMAVGGDRIELAPGDYGDMGFGQDFTSDVTIVSADPDNPAVVRKLAVFGASHLVFDGILFDYAFSEGQPLTFRPFEVVDSSHVTIRNSVFDGALEFRGLYGTGIGLQVVRGDNITIENNEFYHWYKAAGHGDGINLVVRNNDVHSMMSDGFNFVNVDEVVIEGNWFHDFLGLPDGGHNDMIQFWTTLGGTPARNVIIRGNFFDGGLGVQMQTIFMRNGIVDTGQGSFNQYAYRNILIEENVIYNGQVHGITVGETDGLVIRNNTILFDQYLTNGILLAPQIRLKDTSLNVTLQRNILHYDVAAKPGWVVGQNLKVSLSGYPALFVNALIQNPTLADLRALPGTVIMTDGLGAEMTRSDVVFEAGPEPGSEPSPPPDPDPTPDPDPIPEPDPAPDPEAEQMQLSDLIINLINAGDNSVVMRLTGDEFLDPAFMASGDATIGVDLEPSAPTVGSMKLTVGIYTKTEGVAPYTLFGDFNNNFTGGLVLFEGGHTLRLEVFDDGGAGIGDFLVPFTVGVEPVQVLDPAVQLALDALQGQIDMNLGRLTVLEDAHDALVTDVDAKNAALDDRVVENEERIAAGAAGLGG